MIETINIFIAGISITYIYFYNNKRFIYLPLILKYIFIFYLITIFTDTILFKTILCTNKTLFYFFPIYSIIEIISSKPILLLNIIVMSIIILNYYFNFYEGIEWLILFHYFHIFSTIIHTFLQMVTLTLINIFKKSTESFSLRRSLRLSNKPKINYKI